MNFVFCPAPVKLNRLIGLLLMPLCFSQIGFARQNQDVDYIRLKTDAMVHYKLFDVTWSYVYHLMKITEHPARPQYEALKFQAESLSRQASAVKDPEIGKYFAELAKVRTARANFYYSRVLSFERLNRDLGLVIQPFKKANEKEAATQVLAPLVEEAIEQIYWRTEDNFRDLNKKETVILRNLNGFVADKYGITNLQGIDLVESHQLLESEKNILLDLYLPYLEINSPVTSKYVASEFARKLLANKETTEKYFKDFAVILDQVNEDADFIPAKPKIYLFLFSTVLKIWGQNLRLIKLNDATDTRRDLKKVSNLVESEVSDLNILLAFATKQVDGIWQIAARPVEEAEEVKNLYYFPKFELLQTVEGKKNLLRYLRTEDKFLASIIKALEKDQIQSVEEILKIDKINSQKMLDEIKSIFN